MSTSGYFAGQSTATTEQRTRPASRSAVLWLVMVMMMVGNAATAANTQNSGAHEYDRLQVTLLASLLLFTLLLSHQLIGFVVYRAPLLPV